MEKVWVYLSSKVLEGEILKGVIEKGQTFVQNWKAHEMPLIASFEVLYQRFIVVKVNETQYNASGCSIDKLLRLIKQLEADYSIELLNRLLVAYDNNGRVEVVHVSKIKEMLEVGVIKPETIFFDTAVSDSANFLNWKLPMKDTWLKKYL
jgi:hypothetical protein